MRLKVVQEAMADHEGNPPAMRAILERAIERQKPEGSAA